MTSIWMKYDDVVCIWVYPPEKVIPAMKHWRNREDFKARVLAWATKLDVKASAIYIRPMRRKWASCSTAGTLSFNDELLEMSRELGDYVIVHELLHFSVPNHGKLWKSLMRAYLGDYHTAEETLQNNQC
jgi:predicted metal-dependent hydrolase